MPNAAMNNQPTAVERLLTLSHQLGREDRKLAILGEGNTSTRVSERTFIVKASGSNLMTLSPLGVTECRFGDLVPLLDRKAMTDVAIDEALFASRADANAKKPSVE